jgi:deoxycytidylate deaminase
MKTERFFRYAKNIAEMSDFEKQKMGCVVVYKKQVLSTGFNTTKTHPMQKIYNKYRFEEDSPHKLHAEINALLSLRNADIDWSKVKVFVYRKSNNGRGALARPCPSCMAYMKKLGIKHIYYSTYNEPVHEVLDM